MLRALELVHSPRGCQRQIVWIAERLTLAKDEVEQALAVLQTTGQVEKTADGYRPRKVVAVDTSRDPARARKLKLAWTETALSRLQAGARLQRVCHFQV